MAEAETQAATSPRKWSSFFFGRSLSGRSILSTASQIEESGFADESVSDSIALGRNDCQELTLLDLAEDPESSIQLPKYWQDTTKRLGSKWLQRNQPFVFGSADEVQEYSNQCSCPDLLQHISRDVPRTFSDDSFFVRPEVQQSLECLLQAVTSKYQSVGYVQGLNFVLGYVLVHSKNMNEAFAVSCTLLENKKFNLSSLYEINFEGLFKLVDILSLMIAEVDQPVHKQLELLGLDSLFFAHNWILTLFTYSMPFQNLAEIWTYFFEHGWSALLRLCVALIQTCRDDILSCTVAQDNCANQVLTQITENPPVDIVRRAKTLAISSSVLPKRIEL